MNSLLLKNAKVVIADKIKEGDVRIEGEKIKEIAKVLSPKQDEEVIDLAGKLLLPGLIDSHVHFSLHSRGTVTIDDFYSGGVSAAFGGVTTIIDYADQVDNSLIKGLVKRKLEARDSVIDYNLHLCVDNNLSSERYLKDFYRLRENGISSLKAFTTYSDIYMLNNKKWTALFKAAKQAEMLVTVHAENDQIIQDNILKYRAKKQLGVEYHPDIRSSVAEAEAISELCQLLKHLEMSLYIVHLSSQKGYQQILKAREQGVDIYAETAPHYLLLTRQLLEGEGGRLNLMSPPLREKEDNRVLWNGVAEGEIDVIATDHCAFSVEQKKAGGNSLDILPGIPGVETMLPLIYTYGVKVGKISLTKMVELLSTNPAKIFGLYSQKGSIEVGKDADLVVFDPDLEVQLQGDRLHSKAGYTSFEGIKVKGMPVMTILRGKKIVAEGKFLGKRGYGKFIKADKSVVYR